MGPHGGKTSVREYDRLVGEWLAGGRVLVAQVERHGMTIAELCRAYKAFAERYYRKEGRPTPTVDSIRVSLRTLRQMYGDTLAAEFGPLSLAAVRQRFIDNGACRRYANGHASRIRRAFRWASTQELLPISTYQALAALPGLQRGRCEAREAQPIGPVDDATVDATIPHLPHTVAAMVRLQRLTGMRPAEVCILRPCDLDRSGEVSLAPRIREAVLMPVDVGLVESSVQAASAQGV
ncbi:MAG TPA: hypothetical protein VHD36_22460 [Pirellulales bacterium]|nr:hypothetical protein [Pirellulales bacterium]